jgi:hypothetical protein
MVGRVCREGLGVNEKHHVTKIGCICIVNFYNCIMIGIKTLINEIAGSLVIVFKKFYIKKYD